MMGFAGGMKSTTPGSLLITNPLSRTLLGLLLAVASGCILKSNSDELGKVSVLVLYIKCAGLGATELTRGALNRF